MIKNTKMLNRIQIKVRAITFCKYIMRSNVNDSNYKDMRMSMLILYRYRYDIEAFALLLFDSSGLLLNRYSYIYISSIC